MCMCIPAIAARWLAGCWLYIRYSVIGTVVLLLHSEDYGVWNVQICLS